jgi:hypothetical protein
LIQARLRIGHADDPLEHEADRVADQVVRSPESRSVSAAPRLFSPSISNAAAGPQPRQSARRPDDAALGMVRDILGSTGMPLDPGTRTFMEERFKRNFSGVRVHTSSFAEQSAECLDANAYTVGHHVVFGAGQYAPGTVQGRRLIAHELTHVLQQSGSSGATLGLVQRDDKHPTSTASKPAPSKAAAPPAPAGPAPASETKPSLSQFWSAVAAVGEKEHAMRLVQEAVQRMMAAEGDKLKEIEINIYELEHGYSPERNWDAIQALKAKRQAIFDAYDPSIVRSSRAPIVPRPLIPLPYATIQAPLSGPVAPALNLYPPNIPPDNPLRTTKYGGVFFDDSGFRSSVGDAYAYEFETDNFEVANDLERIARAGYTEIHIATGTHGSPGGARSPKFKFLKEDARSIYETMQRHPGLKIIPYNMADPAQAAAFTALQARAAGGQLPGGATVAAYCHSRVSVPDPNEGPAGPYSSVEVLDGSPPGSASYGQGAFAAGFGALGIYAGLHDPNRVEGDIKIAAGTAQLVGGASYMAGAATDSLTMVRWGSRLAEGGGYVAAPFVVYDVLSDMGRKFDPGGMPPMTGEESVYYGMENTMKLAGLLFPEAAVGAVALEYVVKPGAQMAADYITPTFIGAIAESYDIPTWRH